MADEVKNVFISHLHEDDAGLADLKQLIKKGRLSVRDSSINSSNPNDAKDTDYIKSQILALKSNGASTLLVYITPNTKDSKWVNWRRSPREKTTRESSMFMRTAPMSVMYLKHSTNMRMTFGTGRPKALSTQS
jgi:antiphage defense system Thoeris ThsB-like protein